MATSRAANVSETGRKEEAVVTQDVSNPARDRQKFADPSGETMKALVWLGKNDVAVADVPKPRIIEDTDVILKVTGSTICGSDLHLYHGSVLEMQKGDILGHEFCGEIESVGASVKKLKKGHRVVASFQIACGDCRYCKRKLSSQCERTNASQLENALYGSRTAGQYYRCPIQLASPGPGGWVENKGLYLSDVLSTAWHCVVDTGVREGDVVAIWGAGPIGQMCAEFSFLHGASRVILIDGGAGAWRLDFVKGKLPRVETVDYSTLQSGESVTSVLKEMVGDGQGPDVALECAAGEYAKGWAHYIEIMLGAETDTSEILNEMVTSVRNFGRCGITGVYVGYTNHFNIGSLMQRGVRLIGNGQAPVQKYWEHLLSLIESGTLDPLRMVSTRVKLEDLDLVYRMYDERKKGIQKVFVQTKFSKEQFPGSPALAEYE
ncbi:oxidoreductase [Blastomyces silverae]|uniref:Oxidoreductase n=1 Tax=Blastomyces silverae TaxID=2060906 RepID=A0A0H1BB52_9EURO|nr:oxidoreductase [Blastomyces silverae]